MQQTLTNGDTIYIADIDGIDYTHIADSFIISADGKVTFCRAIIPISEVTELVLHTNVNTSVAHKPEIPISDEVTQN